MTASPQGCNLCQWWPRFQKWCNLPTLLTHLFQMRRSRQTCPSMSLPPTCIFKGSPKSRAARTGAEPFYFHWTESSLTAGRPKQKVSCSVTTALKKMLQNLWQYPTNPGDCIIFGCWHRILRLCWINYTLLWTEDSCVSQTLHYYKNRLHWPVIVFFMSCQYVTGHIFTPKDIKEKNTMVLWTLPSSSSSQ